MNRYGFITLALAISIYKTLAILK